MSVDTSSHISTNPELENARVSLAVKEKPILTLEERRHNLCNEKEDNSTQLSSTAGISVDEEYLDHFSEGEGTTEGNPIKAEGNDIEEIYSRDTPSSMESAFSENLSTDSDYFETGGFEIDASKCQGNTTSYERNYTSKQRVLRTRFRDIVKFARKALAEARVAAQEESVAKRYQVATQKKRELQRRRAEKRREMLSTPTSQNKTLISSKIESTGGTSISWDKAEMKEIRKVHAELDRAKAKKSQVSFKRDKRRVSIVSTTALQPLSKNSEFDKYEIDRLVKELHSLNLPEKASELAHAFRRKVDTEHELRSQLKKDRREAVLEAKRQKLEEIARLREEEKRKRLEEKERKELERKEREKLERMRKLEEDRRKKIHNLHMWASFHRAGFANSVSRPFTTSYFPKLHDHADSKESKTTSEYARICALRLRCHESYAKSRKTPKAT